VGQRFGARHHRGLIGHLPVLAETGRSVLRVSRQDRRTRTFERGALLAFAPVVALVPVWLLAITAFWLPARLVVDVPLLTFAACHLALSALLFVPVVQRTILTRLIGTRPPTADELEVLGPAWRTVARAAGVRRRRFVIAVIDEAEVNAFACGGHLLVVSSFAVNTLPADELTGVLAHELGHHLGSHTVALTIGQWMSVPIWLLARAGIFLEHVAEAATDTFTRGRSTLEFIGQGVATILRAASWILLAGLIASQAIGNLVGRGAEFEADRRAIRLGFGRELVRALRRTAAAGIGHRPVTIGERLAASHPPVRTRIARIDAALRRGRHPSMRRTVD
jgi:Zn-dependent protease with chaperone function